jgi:hypothetical protein
MDIEEVKEMVKPSVGKESLREKQSRFMLMVSYLVQFAYEQGYQLTLGDGYRDPRAFGAFGENKAYGRSESIHKQRLAIDLNLFLGGKWLDSSAEHEPLGKFWESIGGSWGGRFNDGNHYSLEHGGRR